MDQDQLAEQIYNAVLELLKEARSITLIAAVADAREGLTFDKASSKTREVFRALAGNLTRVQARR